MRTRGRRGHGPTAARRAAAPPTAAQDEVIRAITWEHRPHLLHGLRTHLQPQHQREFQQCLTYLQIISLVAPPAAQDIASKGIGLWQNGSGSARKGSVSPPAAQDACAAPGRPSSAADRRSEQRRSGKGAALGKKAVEMQGKVLSSRRKQWKRKERRRLREENSGTTRKGTFLETEESSGNASERQCLTCSTMCLSVPPPAAPPPPPAAVCVPPPPPPPPCSPAATGLPARWATGLKCGAIAAITTSSNAYASASTAAGSCSSPNHPASRPSGPATAPAATALTAGHPASSAST